MSGKREEWIRHGLPEKWSRASGWVVSTIPAKAYHIWNDPFSCGVARERERLS